MEIWNMLNTWPDAVPIRAEAAESVAAVAALLLARALLLNIHFRRHPDFGIESKRRFLVASRNITLLLVLFSLAFIWSAQIQTLALSMFAVAAAVVVATKELIMCLSGSILRSATQQYFGRRLYRNQRPARARGRHQSVEHADDAGRSEPLGRTACGNHRFFPQQPVVEPPRAPRQYFGRLCHPYGRNPRSHPFGFG